MKLQHNILKLIVVLALAVMVWANCNPAHAPAVYSTSGTSQLSWSGATNPGGPDATPLKRIPAPVVPITPFVSWNG